MKFYDEFIDFNKIEWLYIDWAKQTINMNYLTRLQF